MLRRSGSAALVAALVLVGAGCGSSHGSAGAAAPTSAPSSVGGSPATAGASSVNWTACEGNAGPTGFQCATVMVPRDPQDPAKGMIGMAIDRAPATGQKIGSLLINPGGPGASGVDSLPYVVGEIPSSVLKRFDVVGFDPPGVDRTAPITCLDSSGLAEYFHIDPAPTTTAGFNTLIAEDRTFAAGCEQESSAELPYVSTVDAAMDMDHLRQALGDTKLTYLGFSYGTFLGATYAELYPGKVRAMVLDGALNPDITPLQLVETQSVGLENDLNQFFAACTSSSSCSWKPGPDPQAAFESLLAQVRRSPLPAKGTSRTVGPSEVLYGTGAALYDTTTWPVLEQALAQASQGNGTTMLSLFDSYTGRNANGTYSNLFEANAAINCLDAPAPTIAQIQANAAAAEAAAPIFGLQNLYSEAGCSVWPVPATGKVAPIHAPGAPPIVVVGSTGDPVTPYVWAQRLASQLDSGVLLTRVGEGHTGYRSSSCIRKYVDDYLVNLTPPPAGTSCKSD